MTSPTPKKSSWTPWAITKLVLALLFGLFVYHCTSVLPAIDPEKAAVKLVGVVEAIAPSKAIEKTGCKASDFSVTGIKMRREYGYIIFTGTIRNTSAFSCGVQLKATTYDKTETVLDTDDFWPASIRNIKPGATENFKHMHRYDKEATNYDILPINAKPWRG